MQLVFLDDLPLRPRREAPARPIWRETVDIAGPPPLRLGVLRLWNPHAPLLGWVVYRAVPDERDTGLRRIIRWSYQGAYGGCLIVALYPVVAKTRTLVDALRDAADPEALVIQRDLAASTAGMRCQALRIKTIVLATGDLDAVASVDLTGWIDVFRRYARRGARFMALDTTLAGWPVAPATSGLAPPAEALELVPWRFPMVPVK